jgi:hypothetical protein
MTAALRNALVSSASIQQADWGRTRYLLSKYGNQLFPRAGEEIREAYEQLKADEENLEEQGREFLKFTELKHRNVPSFVNWQPGQYQSRGLEDGDIEYWWTTVSHDDFCPGAASQIAQAWVGAIEQTGLDCKTPLEEVRDFFAHFSYPWWPDAMTTERLRSDMGLSNDA